MLCRSSLLFKHINKISDKNSKKEKYLPDIFEIFYFANKAFTYVLCNESEKLGINTVADFNKLDQIHLANLNDPLNIY